MIQIHFTNAAGEQRTVETNPGTSVMRAAVDHGVDEILAECGGNAQCATCHVYIDPDQLSLLPAKRGAEDDMLDATAEERKPNSRLSCQVMLTAAMDGLRVTLPATQA